MASYLLGVREIRAVTPTRTFSMKPGKMKWGTKEAAARALDAYKIAAETVTRRFWSEIANGTMTTEQAEAEHFNEVWRLFSLEMKTSYKVEGQHEQ